MYYLDVSEPSNNKLRTEKENCMPKYLIEREIPGAGKLSAQELQAISRKSCGILEKMGSQIQWIQSYVTEDKVYCIYIAPNSEMVLEHARQGGFPADRVSEIKTMIDPTTAE
jgi:Protein of unknown function (DUF4242)